MILLDTTFLIDLLKKRSNAVNKTKDIENRDTLATTYVNVYELLLGVYSLKNINHEEKLVEANILLEKLEILSLDKNSAILSAKIGGDLTLKGQIVGDMDNMIAGIALSNGISTIVSRDKGHFSRIKGIKVETY